LASRLAPLQSMALLVKLRAEAPEVVLLPGTLGRRMKAKGRPPRRRRAL
jgi:hypothetical protein